MTATTTLPTLHNDHTATINGEKVGKWAILPQGTGYIFHCGCGTDLVRFLKGELRERIAVHRNGPDHHGTILTSPPPSYLHIKALPPINPDLYARSAAETIQAAIDKLEAQSAVATRGPWVPQWEDEFDARVGIDYSSRPTPLTGTMQRPNAELIVTLHRTIDAQLAILRASAGFDYPAVLDLARAILGEE